MPQLPINHVLPDIQKHLESHNRVVLQAPPGAGKTTAIPIALLDEAWSKDKKIIMLEPRRLAARNAAARMAFLLDEKVGQTVGYQIRQDSCYSEKTKILVVTEGILTRKLQADPELSDTALVIFDEFHERSLHADLSLALCLQSQQILRENLKILVMSATLNTGAIADLLNHEASDQAPVIQSQGRSYPVENIYLDKTIKADNRYAQNTALITTITNTIKHVIEQHQGSCLVFLPGVREINRVQSEMNSYLQSSSINNIQIAPLHGSLTKQQQDLAITASSEGKRKIVLATNIAETSLTIEGISCVIDSGLEKILDYNPASGMNRLKTQFISQDSATQRSGRAGRLTAGTCYRLWTQTQQQRLQKHSVAEILHSDLSPLVLELANWGVQQADEMQWLDNPPDSAVAQAKTLLVELRAIDAQEKITAHGQNILKLGSHPRLSHMMLSAMDHGQSYHACLIASILSEKDLLQSSDEKSIELQDRLRLLAETSNSVVSRSNQRIDHQLRKRILQTANDFYKRLRRCGDKHRENSADKHIDYEMTGVLLAHAYPDRIAQQRRANAAQYLLSNGKGASIPEFLQHHLYEFLVVANLDAKGNEASIYLAAEISEQQLQDYFSDNISDQETVSWNETQQRVEINQTSNIGKIILQKKLITARGDNLLQQKVQQTLLQAIRSTGLECLNWSEKAVSLKQRMQLINNYDKESMYELPDFSDKVLTETLEDWLQPYLNDENSIKQCQKLDLYKLLLNQIDWQQQQLIDKLAPERITVPSGSAIRIDYSDTKQPILAVRLQEVFGLNETPTIIQGKIKLMMHLLSPARKPMQVTQDLNSFWETTYHEVKKELRGKYKRHYWPDDPFDAQATSKTKKQMNRDLEMQKKNGDNKS